MLSSTSRAAVVAALCALTVPAAACAARAGRAQETPAAPTAPPAPATSSAQAAPSAQAAKGAPAAEAHAIIVGGGATPEEGKAWLERWDKAAYFHDKMVRPAEGYPRLVKSDDVPGLRPGLHVVLLGVCSAADVGSRLSFVKSFLPGTYARPVSSPPDACPAMPFRSVVHASKAIEKDGGRVLVNVYFSPQDEGLDPVAAGGTRGGSGGSRPGSYKVLAAAFRPGDVLYTYGDEKTYRAERDPATGIKVICKLELSGTNQKIVLDAVCDEEDPPACTGRTTHVVSRTTYEFDGQALGEKAHILEKKVSKLCD